jgi:hypothetical protein
VLWYSVNPVVVELHAATCGRGRMLAVDRGQIEIVAHWTLFIRAHVAAGFAVALRASLVGFGAAGGADPPNRRAVGIERV